MLFVIKYNYFAHSLQMNCSGTGIAMGPMVVRSFFYAVSETGDDSSLATQNEVLIMERLMQGSVNVLSIYCIHTGLNSETDTFYKLERS